MNPSTSALATGASTLSMGARHKAAQALLHVAAQFQTWALPSARDCVLLAHQARLAAEAAAWSAEASEQADDLGAEAARLVEDKNRAAYEVSARGRFDHVKRLCEESEKLSARVLAERAVGL